MYIHLNVFKQMTDVKFLMLQNKTWNHLTCVQKNYYEQIEWFLLDRNTWNFLTVCKNNVLRLVKNVINKMCLQIIYIYIYIYIYKEDLALNNLRGLICHKTQPNQTKYRRIRIDRPARNNIY